MLKVGLFCEQCMDQTSQSLSPALCWHHSRALQWEQPFTKSNLEWDLACMILGVVQLIRWICLTK